LIACFEGDNGTVESLLELGRSKRMPDVAQADMVCALREGRVAAARLLAREVLEMIGDREEVRARFLMEVAFVERRLGDPERARQVAAEVAVSSRAGPASSAWRISTQRWGTGRGLMRRWHWPPRISRTRRLSRKCSSRWCTPVACFRRGGRQTRSMRSRPCGRFDRRWPDIALLRAQALLQAGERPRPRWNSRSWSFSRRQCRPPRFSRWRLLGVRARPRRGGADRRSEAGYDRALAVWKNADVDFAPLLAARKERAALR
jgi:hypothetical protein